MSVVITEEIAQRIVAEISEGITTKKWCVVVDTGNEEFPDLFNQLSDSEGIPLGIRLSSFAQGFYIPLEFSNEFPWSALGPKPLNYSTDLTQGYRGEFHIEVAELVNDRMESFSCDVTICDVDGLIGLLEGQEWAKLTMPYTANNGFSGSFTLDVRITYPLGELITYTEDDLNQKSFDQIFSKDVQAEIFHRATHPDSSPDPIAQVEVTSEHKAAEIDFFKKRTPMT